MVKIKLRSQFRNRRKRTNICFVDWQTSGGTEKRRCSAKQKGNIYERISIQSTPYSWQYCQTVLSLIQPLHNYTHTSVHSVGRWRKKVVKKFLIQSRIQLYRASRFSWLNVYYRPYLHQVSLCPFIQLMCIVHTFQHLLLISSLMRNQKWLSSIQLFISSVYVSARKKFN